jgi:hypothetical protein
MSDCIKKIAEAVAGLAVAVGAGVAWQCWQIDGTLAVLIAFSGLGMIGHAFGDGNW